MAQVSIGGQQKPAIRIQLDPAKLVAKGLSLEDVRIPLSVTTVDNPKGTIRGPTRSFTIYTNDQLTESKDWNDVIVAFRDGAPLRVRDIGQAVTGPQDTTQAAWADGKRGLVLVIYKQPGANVIDTVDRINAELPRLQATIPPAIKIFTLADRTQTIRAAVRDVQFTLLLTIALVVMVIFIFLRNLWATIIPSVTVPLALLGACALMWLVGYSLDNLSLMALTIAVGFVVDDAIVMLENITRYVEEGEEPFAAALKGSREITFTIVSISVSLIAVLIPLLLMGGIIGRLFREFAVTLSMAIVVSAFVSLTLTPMMASRFLKPPQEAHHGRLYALSERGFDALLRGYDARPRCRAAIPLHHALRVLRDRRALGLSVRDHPQGLLSATGHRPHHRHFRGGAGCLARRHDEASAGAGRDRAEGSGRRSRRNVHGRHGQCAEQRTHVHHSEAARGASRECRSGHCAAAAPARQGPGREAVPAGGAGRARRRPRVAHPVPIHAARLRYRAAQRVGAEDARQAQEPAGAARRRHRSADRRHDADADDQSRPGIALRTDAATDRRHALRRLRPAPDRAIFHAAFQLLRDHGGAAVAAGRSRDPRPDLPAITDDGRPGAAGGLRQMDDDADPAAVDQPSGPVPGDHHQLQPGAGRGARSGDGRDRAGQEPS